MNIVDWSKSDLLAVGLGNTAYIWGFQNQKVTKLSSFQHYNMPTLLSWEISEAKTLLVGTLNGLVQLWDPVEGKIVRELRDHQERVGAGSVLNNMLLTGGRDKTIIM